MISKAFQLEELKDLLCGEHLGNGISRQVHVYKPDESLVLKVSTEDPQQNVIEWKVWWEISECERLRKWFAPCVAISACGVFLLQKRAESRPRAEYPSRVPAFFTDQKFGNFGWIGTQFVCVDYGSLIVTNGLSMRTKKADWW